MPTRIIAAAATNTAVTINFATSSHSHTHYIASMASDPVMNTSAETPSSTGLAASSAVHVANNTTTHLLNRPQSPMPAYSQLHQACPGGSSHPCSEVPPLPSQQQTKQKDSTDTAHSSSSSHQNTTPAFGNTIQELSGSQGQAIHSHDVPSPLSAAPSLPRSNSTPSPYSPTTSDEVTAMMALRDLKETPFTSSAHSPAKPLYCPETPPTATLPAQNLLFPSSKPYKRQFNDSSVKLLLARTHTPLGLRDLVSARFEESRRRNESVTVAMPAKRKRDDSESEKDHITAAVAIQPLPKIAKPTPRKKKTSDGIARCSKCERQAYTQDNSLVRCSRCEELWHQLCHSPEIGKETTAAPSGWKCSVCLADEDELARYYQARQDMLASTRHQTSVDTSREKYFQSLPLGVSTRTPELVGFGPGETNEDMRFDYFSSLDRGDQLSLLAFCDKLQPNLLAEVLTTISSRYPALALFSSPDWANRAVSGQPFSSLPVTDASPASVSGATLPNNVRTQPGSRRARLHTPLRKHLVNTVALSRKPDTRVYIPRRDLEALRKRSEPAANSNAALSANQTPATPALESSKSVTPTDDEEVDALPATWPRPGHGLYAKLLSETVDAKHLLDPHDTIAFHHFTVDQRGKLLPKMAVAALV
ncbi:uncharacterized protein BROUX77_000732 [Berkeleyomyces rouxiae]|uniref:uncharacterized protein n=1 Tax=Berkeleyomyces rouxiae TaxID=2035830 RepID=UPI003B7889E3